jgi:hypothetical protein
MSNVISLEMVLYSLEVTVVQNLPTCAGTIPVSPHTHTRNQLFCAANKKLFTVPLIAPRTQRGRTALKI